MEQVLEYEQRYIPIDVIRNMLSKLPLRSAMRFRIVCKEWNSAISDPNFRCYHESVCVMEESYKGVCFHSIDEYVDRFSISSPLFKPGYKNIHVSNSCNGMVLICLDITVFLFNPSTRYLVNLLTIKHLSYSDNISCLSLCYDESVSDYKAVILLSQRETSVNDGQFVIQASLKGKRWRKSRFPFYFDIRAQGGPFLNGRLHWVCNSNNDAYIHFLARRKIVCFDPVSDGFQELPSPPLKPGVENAIIGLGVLEGCLWMARYNVKSGVEVLKMKEYGVTESWTIMFVLTNSQINGYHHRSLIPLFITKETEILLLQSNKVILAYNLETKLCRKYYCPKVGSLSAVTLVENIVSLSELRVL